jgi:hypothetical protein
LLPVPIAMDPAETIPSTPKSPKPLSLKSSKTPKISKRAKAVDSLTALTERTLLRKLKADVDKYDVSNPRSRFANLETRLTRKTRTTLVVRWHILHAPEGLPSPATIDAMRKLGVSHYRVDYLAAAVTSYLSTTSKTCSFPSRPELKKRTIPFSIEDLIAPIRRFQESAPTERTQYKELSKAIVDAGVTDYTCYVEGRKVVYNGVLGESHIEWFAPRNPIAQEDGLTVE